MMKIKNGSRVYQISKQVGGSGNYRLYLCMQAEANRQCLLQIVTAAEFNGELQLSAYILKELQRRADELEKEYEAVKKDPKVLLNYQLEFPEMVDSFVCQEQGGRQINILAFRNVEDVSKMVPLVNITEKERLRVDLRTSAWIMGKLLKLLTFAHSEGISVGLINGNNVLIVPDQHYVLIFDWSAAQINPEAVPIEVRRQDIAQAAQAVVCVLGGDPQTGIIPNDDDKTFDQYIDYLLRLAHGSESNAKKAHTTFYKLIDSLWKREFYPFTTKPLGKNEEEE
ncbi:MAG: hypothetical protein V1863_07505 [Candidatus Omnitrophota bacterium]